MKSVVFVMFLLVSCQLLAADDRVAVGRFSAGDLVGWQSRSFSGNTIYQLAEDDSNTTVLSAVAESSASGFVRRIRIDLQATPFINWRWKINNRLSGLDETTRDGDDYAARLYVVVSPGALFWKTKALNYVWSGNQNKGSIWRNAYSPRKSIMIALRGVDAEVGQWISEKRNVLEDFKDRYGQSVRYIDAVAIMTDTDNSGRRASAAYGDIFFTRY